MTTAAELRDAIRQQDPLPSHRDVALSMEHGQRGAFLPYPAERRQAEFWRRVNKNGPLQRLDLGECWIWTGSTNGEYGEFWNGHRKVGAHVFAYGPMARGQHIDHLCGTKLCVRKSHLEAVTSRENTLRFTAQITHCPQGHPYEGANLILRPTIHGGITRRCRECHRVRSAARYARRKAAQR